MGEWVTSAATGLVGGESAIEGQARAAELKMQAKAAEIQGKQDATERTNNLDKQTGAIAALVAQRGISADSPSVAAYTGGVQKEADRNIGRTRDNATMQSMALRRSASNALFNGYANAGADLLKAASGGV